MHAADDGLPPGRSDGRARACRGSTGQSQAEVIRSAIAAATSVERHPKPRLPLFDSGDATLAERVDAELAAGYGD